jgi:hypothetical protein
MRNCGEVNVKNYLEDFEENVGKLKDRFSRDNSASMDAEVVLRQASEWPHALAQDDVVIGCDARSADEARSGLRSMRGNGGHGGNGITQRNRETEKWN